MASKADRTGQVTVVEALRRVNLDTHIQGPGIYVTKYGWMSVGQAADLASTLTRKTGATDVKD